MSEDLKGTNGAPVETANGVDAEVTQSQTETATNKDVVAYETYRKTLSLAKKREQELDTLRQSNQKLLDEKLASEGKKDELLGSREKRIQELEGKLKKVVGAFGHKSLANVVAQEAAKEGCVNIGDLISLSDLSSVEVDDEFNVNVDQVKEIVSRAKKERAYLFSQKSTAAKTGVPTTGVMASADEWKKLSPKDQLKMAFADKK